MFQLRLFPAQHRLKNGTINALCTALLFSMAFTAPAWETDQFTLPERPLVDVGPEISRYVQRELEEALLEINTALLVFPAELKALRQHHYAQRNFVLSLNPRYQHRARKHKINTLQQQIESREQALEKFSSKVGIASHMADRIGRPIAVQEKVDGIFGLPTIFATEWAENSSFVDSYYRPDRSGNVYAMAGFHRGLHAAYFILSSTINAFGHEVGIDKLGHFFNQGHDYFEQYNQALRTGSTSAEAFQSAVQWGVISEAGRYGLVVSGIYSNGDLATNIAGLHFYINLFEPITLSGQRYPAMLTGEPGSYQLAAAYREQPETMLSRLFSDHMNEALNPSRLESLQVQAIQTAVESRCPQWRARWPERDKRWYADTRRSLTRWHGMRYGHDATHSVLISELCFNTNQQVDQ